MKKQTPSMQCLNRGAPRCSALQKAKGERPITCEIGDTSKANVAEPRRRKKRRGTVPRANWKMGPVSSQKTSAPSKTKQDTTSPRAEFQNCPNALYVN